MEKIISAINLLCRLAVAAIFIYAGILKLLNPAEFLASVETFQILPPSLAMVSTYFLPTFEILLGVLLLTKRYQNATIFLLAMLTLVFIAAIILSWIRGLNISCGCFGEYSTSNYIELILRDIGILMLLGFSNLKKLTLKDSKMFNFFTF